MTQPQRWSWLQLLGGLGLGVALVVALILFFADPEEQPPGQESAPEPPRMVQPGDTGPAHWQRPARPVDPAAVPLDGQSRALARAYAWAGQRRDGRLPADAVLDADALAWLPAVEKLLDQQEVRNWRQLEPDAAAMPPTTAAVAPGPALPGVASEGDRALVAGTTPSDELPPGHTWPRPRTVSQAPPPDALTYAGQELAIRQPGMMGDLAFRADEHEGSALRIVDRSGGRHVLIISAEDPGDIRLDGGLVVPGRAYLISGEHQLTGGSDAHVLIRPVDAVSGFHPGPARLPSGEG